MPEQPPIRLAVWGIGYHALKNVLPAIGQCEAVTLAGLYSRNQHQASQAAKTANTTLWRNAEEMLASADVDAVYLCTPIGMHHEQGLRIIRAGKHLLCEKALTAKASHSDELIAAARAGNKALCEAFMYLFHPQYQALAEQVRAPGFGSIVALNCWFGMPELENPGFRSCRALGGGAFLDLACYPISLAAQLLSGDPQVASVAVEKAGAEDVDMMGHLTLRFPGGASAHLEWGFGRAYRNEVCIWGTQESVYADRVFSKSPEFASQLLVRDRRGDEASVEIPPAHALVEMMKVFAQAVRDPGIREKLWNDATRQAEIVGRVEQKHPAASR